MNSPATLDDYSATLNGHSATLNGHSATLDGHYSPTQDEIHQFHSIDRQLYSTMVFQLGHDPTRSLHVLAFILLQERYCDRHTTVAKIVDQPLHTIRSIFLNADTCLRRIMEPTPDPDTLRLIQKLSLSDSTVADFFHEIRQQLKSEIITVVETVCLPAVSDIMQKAMKNSTRRKNHGGGRWPEGRTMFMTFSKGYPVEEWEVREYMKNTYGDVVESVCMAVPSVTEPQPLNAHIVLRSPESVSEILKGDTRSSLQFSIHGKDARLRKYDHDRRSGKNKK